jgi:DNA-binding NarL/FixJ family response regulator
MFDKVYILSNRRLQSELFQRFIKESCGCDCIHSERIDSIVTEAQLFKKMLVLLDFEIDSTNGLRFISSCSSCDTDGQGSNILFVIYNVDPDFDQQEQFVFNGVRGIFYSSDTLNTFTKGLGAIEKGELWVSRKNLERCVALRNKVANDKPPHVAMLTRREIEVLKEIATGATNEEIAEDLCISVYTVKTHNYKIFKKINVNNRMQASLWAINAFDAPANYSKDSPKIEPFSKSTQDAQGIDPEDGWSTYKL